MGRKKLGQNQNAPAIAREFGAHLQRLLDERKLTVDKYSERCEAVGLSKAPSTIWAMLRAESTPPMKDLPLMAKALKLKDWRDMIPPKPGT